MSYISMTNKLKKRIEFHYFLTNIRWEWMEWKIMNKYFESKGGQPWLQIKNIAQKNSYVLGLNK